MLRMTFENSYIVYVLQAELGDLQVQTNTIIALQLGQNGNGIDYSTW